MPTYEFTCITCDKTLTVTCKYEEIDAITCPDCKESMKRSYTFGAVSFKGSGFYSTDKAN